MVEGRGRGREPVFEGLVEAFDFALGLGVAGVTVFLGDAQAGEQAFEVVVAVGESCGVDRSVVGQGGCRQAVALAVSVKLATTSPPVTRR